MRQGGVNYESERIGGLIYRIIVNDKYEISLDSFMKWSGLSRYVVDALAIQNVFQQMNNGDIVKFIKHEETI